MRPRVFVIQHMSPEAEAVLQEELDPFYWEGPFDFRRLLGMLKDVEGMLIRPTVRIDEQLLSAAPRLRAVSTRSVGYDHFDIEAMRRHGVIGTHTPGVLTDSVADFAVGLMLDTARRITHFHGHVQAGLWQKRPDEEYYYGVEMHHKVLGIIGFGRIGQAIARRAHFGFAMPVLYCSRSGRPQAEQELGARRVELPKLLQQADFVVVAAAANEHNRHLLGAAEFAQMKPSAVLVNIARGSLVDEQALAAALRGGALYGAGLDVFEREPLPAQSPLIGLPNVVTAPHIGSASYETREAMNLLAARNLVAALMGRPIPAPVPELGI